MCVWESPAQRFLTLFPFWGDFLLVCDTVCFIEFVLNEIKFYDKVGKGIIIIGSTALGGPWPS
jgi:hypothetical protein